MSDSIQLDENYFEGMTEGEIARFLRNQIENPFADENEQLSMLDDYLEGN